MNNRVTQVVDIYITIEQFLKAGKELTYGMNVYLPNSMKRGEYKFEGQILGEEQTRFGEDGVIVDRINDCKTTRPNNMTYVKVKAKQVFELV